MTGEPAGWWDSTVWDNSLWGQRLPPTGAGWGDDWKVWWQTGTVLQADLTAQTIEARWTTDANTYGDGTFRGDIQPGKLTIRLWDPTHLCEQLDTAGTIWLRYVPLGYCWGFYVDTVTRALVAPGDPAGGDCVVSGSPWPLRLTTDCSPLFNRSIERVDSRLGSIVSTILNNNATLKTPAYTSAVAAQGSLLPAVAPVTVPGTTAYPAALSLIRQAAANGVAWITGAVDGTGAGVFVLNYARWETYTPLRVLAPSALVAGVPFDQTMEDLITHVVWTGTRSDGSSTTLDQAGPTYPTYGESKKTLRVAADLSATGGGVGTDFFGVQQTGVNLFTNYGNPTVKRLSAVTATSGPRVTPAGVPSTAWDPAAHVWSPAQGMDTTGLGYQGWYGNYLVAQTSHQLKAEVWNSAHTLQRISPAYAMAP